MAVKEKQEEGKLTLEFDNGDLQKLNEAMSKWNFKDYQSLARFAVSILLINEGKTFAVTEKGKTSELAPAKELIKTV